MAVIKITDDCMPFTKTISLKYSGPDPYSLSNKLWEDIKTFFQVSTSGVAFQQLNWDDSGDPIEFFMRWWMKKKFGHYSRMQLKMKAVGAKRKADNSGSFSLTMRSWMDTEYRTSFPGPIARILWAVYSYIFYNKQRQRMLKQCQDLTMSYREFLQKKFDMRPLPYEKTYDSGM
jgi:hypothetical protein